VRAALVFGDHRARLFEFEAASPTCPSHFLRASRMRGTVCSRIAREALVVSLVSDFGARTNSVHTL
jgi:hypothetical protein